ncbi:outer membrane beta-barrel protein [Hymenobacter rigui]|uniref:PorT family protein n=1 Tax=Hymenobacter rigui TaxID=334424 RepID=A0A3R9MPJ7_9BACT|nr:outer membrane beta-barrel protein [Hymenobacter rigui]RSK45329.1 PorT family protein [Hymenobacter rigui]
MTENDSEQLYHDLRRKLEGYGSAPPESVWAGIREQVPARQPRRWRPLLVLLLLGFLSGSVLVGSHYWPSSATFAGGNLADAGKPTAARTTSEGSGEAPVVAAAPPRLATEPAEAAATPRTTTTPATAAPSATAAPEVAASATSKATSGRASVLPSRAPHILPTITARTKRERLTGVARRSAEIADATATRGARQRTGGLGLLAVAATRSGTHRVRFGSREAATRGGIDGSRYSRAGRRARTDIRPGNSLTTSSTTSTGTAGSRKSTRATKLSNEPLDLLAVRPQALEVEEPEVKRQRRARKKPSRQELRLRNWSAQLLLGQNVTYRLIGASATQLERLERPGMGFSGQVSGTYAFSRQLSVSGGLGYSEYANSLHYQLRKTSSETLRQIDFRDVYRFITIPVQAQLTLGGNQRWRYGLLGGGTLAFLTSARTTEGSACNCGQREWTSDMPDSTFSRTNLALTAGAFASYQFAPGQWLTLRPQGQLFLNSLTAPSSSAPRRPWGVGVQVGYSWDLDPRKR